MDEDSEKKVSLGRIALARRAIPTAREVAPLAPLHPRLEHESAPPPEPELIARLRALGAEHGLPALDVTRVVVPTSNLELIPELWVRGELVLPVLVRENTLFVAVASAAGELLDRLALQTQRSITGYVALRDDLEEAIAGAYRARDLGESFYLGTRIATGLKSEPPRVPSSPPLDGEAPEEEEMVLAEADMPLPIRSGVTVLVVDDDPDVRRLLKRVLADPGYRVVEAPDGPSALQMVRAEVPDLIILDAILPGVHGFDICRRLRGSQRYGRIPIIMMSSMHRGWRLAEDLRASYAVADFLEKPLRSADVQASVARALRSSTPPLQSDEDSELSQEAAAALERGIEAYHAGALEEAIAHLRQGLNIDPLAFRLHYNLGLLLAHAERLYEAIEQLEAALDLQPRRLSALKNLAVLYERVLFKHKAVEIWERALAAADDEATKQSIKEHLISLL